MEKPFECNYDECPETPKYKYTWPGKDEALLCEKHAKKVAEIANALFLHLRILPLDLDESRQTDISRY